MNPARVISYVDFEKLLAAKDLTKTDTTVDEIGTYWRSNRTGKHLMVPFDVDGMYPDFFIKKVEEQLKAMGHN